MRTTNIFNVNLTDLFLNHKHQPTFISSNNIYNKLVNFFKEKYTFSFYFNNVDNKFYKEINIKNSFYILNTLKKNNKSSSNLYTSLYLTYFYKTFNILVYAPIFGKFKSRRLNFKISDLFRQKTENYKIAIDDIEFTQNTIIPISPRNAKKKSLKFFSLGFFNTLNEY